MSPRDILIQHAILKTVAFFDVIGYAPAWSECIAWVEWGGEVASYACPERSLGESRVTSLEPNPNFQTPNPDFFAPPLAEELIAAREVLCGSGVLESGMGRIALAGCLTKRLAAFFERMPFQARKFRRALRIARLLAWIPGVRFAALANSTAFGHARDGADLDFFIITSAGRLWTARALAAGPFRLLGKLSTPVGGAPDAPCFSYFISDASLDLSSHQLTPDDSYFRYWFLSLLPLYDDGVGEVFWAANAAIRARHPRAPKWCVGRRGTPPACPNAPTVRSVATDVPPACPDVGARFIALGDQIERLARSLQRRWFPTRIRERMNADTSVIVSDHALKFHVDDARAAFRTAYEERLLRIGIDEARETVSDKAMQP